MALTESCSPNVGKNYCYDANGNNTTVRKNGSVIRTIVYTGFDLAESINRNELTSAGQITAQVSFKYGTDRAMYKRVDGMSAQLQTCRDQGFSDRIFCNGAEDEDTLPPTQTVGATVTYYVGNVEFITTGNVLSVKRYIGNYLVITKVGTNAVTYDYLLRDALGSIDTIASESGVLKSRQSFNAHGERRQVAASGWSLLNPVQAANFLTTTTTQGYTGHQQLDAVGLVHMGARLYDAEIGRFIQADDYVEPEATQGLNRYSYVLNNPLSATDPSGNFSLRQALGVVVGVIAAIISQQYWALNNLWASFGVAVGGGFASAAIATGSLKAGLWGAVSAAAFWGIGTYFSAKVTVAFNTESGVVEIVRRVASGETIAKVAAHAIAGGTLAQLQGGKFGHGFISAGFTQALTPAIGQLGDGESFSSTLAQAAASAAVGGTASEASGGSFANGAETAAFQYLFNQRTHRRVRPLSIREQMNNAEAQFIYRELARVAPGRPTPKFVGPPGSSHTDSSVRILRTELMTARADMALRASLPVGQKIAQSQGTHQQGSPMYGGGSYMSSGASTMQVLQAFHSGAGQVLGMHGNSNNQVLFRYFGATGTYHSPAWGGRPSLTLPSNVFILKGSRTVEIVPVNPAKGL
jgi:RHS repeat-associated protein